MADLLGDLCAQNVPGGLEGVAVNPDGTEAYVTSDLGTVSTVDLATHSVAATLSVGRFPFAVAVNPDGTEAYVVNSASNTVSVIELATNTVGATIGVGSFPSSIAVSDDGTNAFVINPGDGTVSVLGLNPAADGALTVTGPTTVADGAKFTEMVTVTNHGPSTATGAATNLYIPPGLAVTAAPGATIESGTLDWIDPTLAPGASTSHSVNFTVEAGRDDTAIVGGVTESAVYDPSPTNNAAITSIHLGA